MMDKTTATIMIWLYFFMALAGVVLGAYVLATVRRQWEKIDFPVKVLWWIQMAFIFFSLGSIAFCLSILLGVSLDKANASWAIWYVVSGSFMSPANALAIIIRRKS